MRGGGGGLVSIPLQLCSQSPRYTSRASCSGPEGHQTQLIKLSTWSPSKTELNQNRMHYSCKQTDTNVEPCSQIWRHKCCWERSDSFCNLLFFTDYAAGSNGCPNILIQHAVLQTKLIQVYFCSTSGQNMHDQSKIKNNKCECNYILNLMSCASIMKKSVLSYWMCTCSVFKYTL